ncbi:hypothetical protein EIK77_007122 [Talaromyces pinophilus]|nr:hypothetical protein EIK77_007122 [Talaromyces pinophilus]
MRRSREINHVKAHLPGIRASVDYASNALLKTPVNVDQPVRKYSFLLFPSRQHPSFTFHPQRHDFTLLKTRLSNSNSATGTMIPLPFPPPGPYNTPPLLDITLATITTVIELGDGRQKEVSCATLRDLLSDFGLEPIPMSIDASWIARLSYAKWATAVVEDMASRLHEEIRPHEGWEIWIPTQWQHLQVFPNDRGFRAAIAKWLTWHSEDFDMDITMFMKKLSNGKK